MTEKAASVSTFVLWSEGGQQSVVPTLSPLSLICIDYHSYIYWGWYFIFEESVFFILLLPCSFFRMSHSILRNQISDLISETFECLNQNFGTISDKMSSGENCVAKILFEREYGGGVLSLIWKLSCADGTISVGLDWSSTITFFSWSFLSYRFFFSKISSKCINKNLWSSVITVSH